MTKEQRLKEVWKKIKKFNVQTAVLVGAITGSMFFFWAFAGVIGYVRAFGSANANALLTAAENDIQVLLISSNAVTGALTLSTLLSFLRKISREEAVIRADLEGYKPEVTNAKRN